MSTDRLRVWIVQNGEELPIDGNHPRLLRAMNLARELSDRGHHVTYWAPSFSHQRREQRTSPEVTHLSDLLTIRLLTTSGYQGSVTPQRILSHVRAARAFTKNAEGIEPPDIVVAGYPTIELAGAAVDYAQRHSVPVIVDFRDQWPDIWVERIPRRLRPLAAPVVAGWHRSQAHAVRRATAVCGITDPFVDWALNAGGRARGPLDLGIPLSPPQHEFSEEAMREAHDYWDERLGQRNDSGPVCIAYAGALTKRIDIPTLINAVDQLSADEQQRLRIVLCGRGEHEALIEAAATRSPSIVAGGWRNAAEISALLNRSDWGLMAYHETSDFLMSYPNKLGEMLSHGLPILTSLGGASWQLIEQRKVGLRYHGSDPASCVAALRTVLSAPVTAEQRLASRQLYDEKFAATTVYPRYADHVEAVASLRGVQRAR